MVYFDAPLVRGLFCIKVQSTLTHCFQVTNCTYIIHAWLAKELPGNALSEDRPTLLGMI